MQEKTASKYMKLNLTDPKGETDVSTIRVRDYSTLPSVTDRTSRRKKSEII